MKAIILYICLIALSGCVASRQRKLERRALDTVKMNNAAGAITDSLYTLKK